MREWVRLADRQLDALGAEERASGRHDPGSAGLRNRLRHRPPRRLIRAGPLLVRKFRRTWRHLHVCPKQPHREVTRRYAYVNVNRLVEAWRGRISPRTTRKLTGAESVQHDTLTIREMCDAFDVTPRTLRFYEAEGTAVPDPRGAEAPVHPARPRAAQAHPARQAFRLQPRGHPPASRSLRHGRPAADPAHPHLRTGAETPADMIRQRDELDEAIEELTAQLKWGPT
jgi:hypothetical protein